MVNTTATLHGEHHSYITTTLYELQEENATIKKVLLVLLHSNCLVSTLIAASKSTSCL